MVCFFVLFSSTQCKKESTTDSNGLPKATEEGKNTLGFLLNGKPWTPQGFNGRSNLRINVDPTYNSGVMSISAYRIVSGNKEEYFSIGLTDSVGSLNSPRIFKLSNTSIFRFTYKNDNCNYYSIDSGTYVNGTLSISKYDKVNRIISGNFNMAIAMQTCDTIKISEGRFDLKF